MNAEKEVYEKTLRLFDEKCAICKNTEIELHHIRHGGKYGGRKTYLGNVIPLCKKHHLLVHSNKKKYEKFLIELINKKL